MWKHNKTLKWLNKKDSAAKSRILNAALKNRSALRKKHKEASLKVQESLKAKMADNEEKRKEKLVKNAQAKATILDNLLVQGSVWTSRVAERPQWHAYEERYHQPSSSYQPSDYHLPYAPGLTSSFIYRGKSPHHSRVLINWWYPIDSLNLFSSSTSRVD
ncbi:hypothetical protein ElyMa_003121100 [Elysia marginata]|uniref:Uncharacterized protein n=1 Tax=Elysia marginata TaxID=1093978 RepID=A0AAV4IR72_9GAST|nr:hypothetical protein ElyMa_003121100 [Elysia marginata]